MKYSIVLLLIFCFISLSETKAQSSDTLQKIQIIKKKSKQFFATITTKDIIDEGLLYAVDSTGITILSSDYDQRFYPIEEITALEIRRGTPFAYAFNTSFQAGLGVGATLVAFFLSTGAYNVIGNSALVVFGLPITFISLGILTGIIVGAISYKLPLINLEDLKPEKYKKSLKRIKRKTQEYLVKHNSNLRKLEISY
jgi:hypothetical protein